MKKENETKACEILDDIYMFRLDFFEWVKVDVKGVPYPGLSNHSVILHESKLIIFGGMKSSHTYNKDLYVMELEWERQKRLSSR